MRLQPKSCTKPLFGLSTVACRGGSGRAFVAQRTRIDPVIRSRLLQVVDSGVVAISDRFPSSKDRLLASYPSSSARKQLSRATGKRPFGRSAAISPGPAEGPIQRKQALGTGCIAVLPVGRSMERFARSFGPCSARRTRGAAAGQDDNADSARRLAQLCVGLISAGPYLLGYDHFGLAQVSLHIEGLSFSKHVVEAAPEAGA